MAERLITNNSATERVVNLLERISVTLAGGLFLLNVINICTAVITRYVFNFSFIWTHELSQFMVIWLTFFGAAATLRQNEHMKIDLVFQRFPPKVQRVVQGVRIGVTIILSLFLIIWGFYYANRLWIMKTMGLGISKAIPTLITPIGMTLFLVMYIFLRIIKAPDVRSTHEAI